MSSASVYIIYRENNFKYSSRVLPGPMPVWDSLTRPDCRKIASVVIHFFTGVTVNKHETIRIFSFLFISNVMIDVEQHFSFLSFLAHKKRSFFIEGFAHTFFFLFTLLIARVWERKKEIEVSVNWMYIEQNGIKSTHVWSNWSIGQRWINTTRFFFSVSLLFLSSA